MQISPQKISSLETMLYDFAGGSLSKNFSQEATNRTIFVTNFMKTLSEIEIDDTTCESINALLDLLLSYDISIFDLYAYCSTNDISIDSIVAFFANYKDYFNARKSALLEKIYLSITSDTVANNDNAAILDVIHKINKLYLVNNAQRITPIVKFSYVIPSNNEFFVNDLSAINAFYRNNQIKTKALATKTFNNHELSTLYDNLIASYNNRDYYLYRYNQLASSSSLINFVMNFTVKTGAANIFYNNVYVDDIRGLLRLLTEELYNLYMRDVVSYVNRDKVFKPGDYYSELYIPTANELTKDNYKYAFFKAMIVPGKQSIISTYSNEISKMKKYISDVQEAALADARFVLGE